MEVLVAVLLKTEVFWDVTLRLVSNSRRRERFWYHRDRRVVGEENFVRQLEYLPSDSLTFRQTSLVTVKSCVEVISVCPSSVCDVRSTPKSFEWFVLETWPWTPPLKAVDSCIVIHNKSRFTLAISGLFTYTVFLSKGGFFFRELHGRLSPKGVWRFQISASFFHTKTWFT